MMTLEHCTLKFLVQMKEINLFVLICQHIKMNKFSLSRFVTKILRKAEVDFRTKKNKYDTKVARSNFFALKINQRLSQPKSIFIPER